MKAELTGMLWGSLPRRENGYLNVKTEKHLCETPGEIKMEKEVLERTGFSVVDSYRGGWRGDPGGMVSAHWGRRGWVGLCKWWALHPGLFCFLHRL